jgi:hypothetical protein
LNYKGPIDRLQDISEEFKRAGYVMHKCALSREGMNAVNGYTRYWVTELGGTLPPHFRFPSHKKVKAKLRSVCDRREDQTLKEAWFEVPEDVKGVKDKRVHFQVSSHVFNTPLKPVM